MEARAFVLAAVAALIVACGALALGWKQVAEDAAGQATRCEQQQRKRVADVPRITVGLDIAYRGEVVASVTEPSRDDFAKIDALYEVLVKDRRPRCDASLVCLDNLVVLEAIGSIQGYVIDRIVRTAWLAGYDVVVAPPHRAGTW